MKAAIYARKSPLQDSVAEKAPKEAKSVTRQIDSHHVFVDDEISGAMFDKGRSGLAALLVATECREFGAIVTMDETRLAREQHQFGYILSQIADAFPFPGSLPVPVGRSPSLPLRA